MTMLNQDLIKQIEALEAQADRLREPEQTLQNKVEELEKQIAGAQQMIDYFDKVEDFSRATHDFDVAEAARSAFSRYCERKYQAQLARDSAENELWQVQDQIDALETQVGGLEWDLFDMQCATA